MSRYIILRITGSNPVLYNFLLHSVLEHDPFEHDLVVHTVKTNFTASVFSLPDNPAQGAFCPEFPLLLCFSSHHAARQCAGCV